MERSKWNRGRSLLLGGSTGTISAMKIASQAAIRSGCGLVSPIVQKHLIDILDVRMGDYNTRIFGIEGYDSRNLDRVLSLLGESNVLGYGIGIDIKEHDFHSFTVELLNHATNPVVVDGQVTSIVGQNVDKLNPKIRHMIILNLKEIGIFFNTNTPSEEQLINYAQKINCFLVLKGENTRIVDPEGKIECIYTGSYPQMTMAGAGDVLLGLVTGFIAQGKGLDEAVKLAIKIRESSTKYYVNTTGDVIATPYDIVYNIRYVIGEVMNNSSLSL